MKSCTEERTTIASARKRLGLPPQDKSEIARAAGKLGGRNAQQGMVEKIARQKEIARQMHDEGKRNREIADRLEIHPSRVTQLLKSMGLISQRHAGQNITVRTTSAPPPPPNNGAALRQVRIKIIKDVWARVVARHMEKATQ